MILLRAAGARDAATREYLYHLPSPSVSDTLCHMLAKVYSCAVIGLEAAIVEVEVDTANGLPSFVDAGSDSQYRSPLYGKSGQGG